MEDSPEIPKSSVTLTSNLIGRGGSANVYFGHFGDTEVAVKVYPTTLSKSKIQKIKDELKMITRLEHPNILRYNGFTKDATCMCLVMELMKFELKDGDGDVVTGHNLRELLSGVENHLAWSIRLKIIYKCASAVKYLHDKMIVHGDLKSSNVLINGQSQETLDVKVADFGESRQKLEMTTMSTIGNNRPCGTLQYLPPESLHGKKATFKQDVYGFSMVMLEVLLPSQDSPWEEDADSSEAIRELVKTGQRPSLPKQLPLECPEWYVPLIKDCWKHDSSLRPDFQYITTIQEEAVCTGNVVNFCLKIHQGTAMEKIGDIAAEKVCKGADIKQDEIDKEIMVSDGTNGCSFFVMLILDYIYTNTAEMTDSYIYGGGLAKKVEEIITDSPKMLNTIRDTHLYYSPDTALDMLFDKNIVKTKYGKYEHIVDLNSDALQKGVQNLIDTRDCKVNCAAYLSPPYTLAVAGIKTVDGNRFGVVIDTHSVAPELGGNNNAIIKCFRITESLGVVAAAKQIASWIARRTESSVNSHSLLQIKKEGTDDSFQEENDGNETWDGIWDDDNWEEDWDTSSVEPLAQSTQKVEEVEVEEPTVEISKENERLFKGYATELGILTLKNFQAKAIQAFTEKRDCLIVQATSSGKSICFQVPSLMLDQGKFVLVVSPTISLMESQVHSLSQHGISAIYFSANSSSTLEEMKEVPNESRPKILYMTPEYLMGNSNGRKEGAIKTFIRMDDDIGLIVIDECHKIFDRSGDFRLCYSELQTLKHVFPSTPIMATTATLQPDNMNSLRKYFLRNPVIIRSTVNRPNMKIHVTNYKSQSKPRKRKLHEQGPSHEMEDFREWEVWKPVASCIAKEVDNIDTCSIVYMDFVKNVKELEQAMRLGFGKDVHRYTGKGMGSIEKAQIVRRFRDKEFKTLLATEAYEVGVHNEHVSHVFRVGAPRNLTVLLQEFGRAGRGETAAECRLFFNEYKDDQRLHYWLDGADTCEVDDIRRNYLEVWRFIYQVLIGKCLREALVENFGEDSDMVEVGRDGCGCDSCEASTSQKFDVQQNLLLLLRTIDELKQPDASEKKVVAWLKGGGDRWVKEEGTQLRAAKSNTFGKGSGKDGFFWSTLLKQAVALYLLDIIFMEFKFSNIWRVVRRFQITEKGHQYLEHPSPVFLPLVNAQSKQACAPLKSKKANVGSCNTHGKHYLPKIKSLLKSDKDWVAIESGDDYAYPGFKATVVFCQDWREVALSSCTDDFIFKDCQLSTSGSHSTEHKIMINNTETEVFVKRGQCEGVKICSGKDCGYVVSRSQHKNRCPQHSKEPLKTTGKCPMNIVYIIPLDSNDRRRWIICCALEDDQRHNHMKPSPHLLPTLVKSDITKALKMDPSLTAVQMQTGKGLDYMPTDISMVAANISKIRRVKEAVVKENGSGKLNTLNVILDFDNIIAKKCDGLKRKSTTTYNADMEKLANPYQMKDTPYIFQVQEKHAFFQNAYQARLMSESDFLNVDVTFTENPTFPYLLNMVAFDYVVLEWVAVSRVLMSRQTAKSLKVAFENVFESTTKNFPSFRNGKRLQGITVDFSDAEARALTEVLGEDLAPNLLRGCKVHWQRSYNRVAAVVCKGSEEAKAFKSIACEISTIQGKDEVLKLFNVLAGEHKVPAKYGSVKNGHWNRLGKWKDWWTREQHLRMFTTAFQTMASYDKCPSTTNPVESINRASSPGKGGTKSLVLVVEHLYKTDKLAVAKRISTENNVTTNYADKGDDAREERRKRKRKWRRSKGAIEDDAEGPPDTCKKIALEAKDDRRSGSSNERTKSCVGRKVQVEILEEGQECTAWYSGTVIHKTSKGYTISFDNYDRSHNITVPCKDVPSEDIILL